MTIRTRLIAAAFVSSAFVALATSASTLFLYRASLHLHAIQTEMIPMVTRAGEVEDDAGELAQAMEDFIDAKSAGNVVEATAASNKISTHFNALHASVDFLAQHVSSLGKNADLEYGAEIARFRQASKSLDADWSRLRDAGPAHSEFSRVSEFDDDAIRLARSATQLQDSAFNITSSRVDTANNYVVWVSRLSAVIAACMSVVTLIIGITFASSLAKRLIRVRDQAQVVGTGNLETTLEVRGQDEIDDIALSFNDMVKALRGSRDKLERDALYDGLTGLPNRVFFMQRLSRCVAEADRLNHHAYALFFLDVDRFKEVNDTLGHAAGDELLRTVAARLSSTVNEFPFCSATVATVARLAGDEFTILLEGEIQTKEATDLGERLRAALAAPMTVEGRALTVTASIGVALGRRGITSPQHILTHADIALYHTKRQGRNGCSLYAASTENEEPEAQEQTGKLDFTGRTRRDADATILT